MLPPSPAQKVAPGCQILCVAYWDYRT